jgi:hypothetical protein
MSDDFRFYVRTKPTLIETFRAFRSALEKWAESQGKTLDPAWYDDGPEKVPHLYKDQPELLKNLTQPKEETDGNE